MYLGNIFKKYMVIIKNPILVGNSKKKGLYIYVNTNSIYAASCGFLPIHHVST